MNVYDFDKTIYKSDSMIDFYVHCIKRHPGLVCYLGRQLSGIIKYKTKKCTKEKMKEDFFSFLKGIHDVDKEIETFAETHLYKINNWYIKAAERNDVVISASPRFLIEKFSEKTTNFITIASEVDKFTGEFKSKNCHGQEKVTRLKEMFPQAHIENFYSDSESDLPLAEMAEKAYKVKGQRIESW